MALNAYLTLKGQKLGDIHGSVTQKGREGSIMVIAMDHQVMSPRDPASGQPTGKRQHKQLVIVKELDKSTPLLYNVLCNNENIPTWQLNFWTPKMMGGTGTGTEVQNFTIKLTNASIASFNLYHPDTYDSGAGGSAPDSLEELSFTYQKIEWTWLAGGISAEDDWESPIGG